ncbi:MAG: hypothetical protein IKG21_11430 [Atopobiaceae bacterium]|nr:hypothetical protein [Atopobiaceae bacterium]
MTTMVSARIPLLLKREGDATLARMGVSHTELIKAAYEYVVTEGRLPTVEVNTQENRPIRLLLGSDVIHRVTACYDPDSASRDSSNKRFDADVRKLFVMASFGDVELWASAYDLCDAMQRDVLYQDVLGVMHVCDFTSGQLAEAVDLANQDFDVALAAVVARCVEADAIVTYNGECFEGYACEVFTPADVALHMRDMQGLEFAEVACVPD